MKSILLPRLLLALLLSTVVSVQGELVWFEETGHYYEAMAEPDGITWEEAVTACENRGGYLATILSSTENEFVFGLIDDLSFWFIDAYNNAIGPWLGGFQPEGSSEPNGDWQWLTEEPWGFTHWGPGEPNNFGGEEDALSYFGWGGEISSQWNDRGKTIAQAFGYIFETESDPTSVEDGKWWRPLILKPYPNPARSGVSIQFSRTSSFPGRLQVYNLGGRLMRSLPLSSAEGAIFWDGNDSMGRSVSAGVYLLHMSDGERSVTSRLALIR